MQHTLFWAAIGGAGLCFVIYCVLTLAPVFLARKEHREILAKAAADRAAAGERSLVAVSPKDIGELVKAFASLVDSMVKAGPALWALIGSMLFLMIAAFAAGMFTSLP
jgi:hypothetical protein